MTFPTDELHTEAPTETIPVVPAEADPGGDYRDDNSGDYGDGDHGDDYGDDLVDDGFTGPKRRSPMTVALFIAVLVAIGFLAGVVVGRDGSASNTPQRGAGTAVSGTARPPGGAGALGRIG